MIENDISQKHLDQMSELCWSSEGAVLSYIKRNMLSFKNLNGEKASLIRRFAENGFDRVLSEMADRDLNLYDLNQEGESQTLLDDYLKYAKWYDPDCLSVIITKGHYSKDDLAKSFINVCEAHINNLQSEDKEIECLNLDIVTDVFLKEGMDFSSLVEGKVPFYALCGIYDTFKSKKIDVSESYQKLIVSCIQKGLENNVDLNVVDKHNKTAFSFKSMELKSKFVRYQAIKDNERLLDLFVIVDQLAKGEKEAVSFQKITKHITQLQKDIMNAKKRMRFD